jgi:hypothetical protein
MVSDDEDVVAGAPNVDLKPSKAHLHGGEEGFEAVLGMPLDRPSSATAVAQHCC